MKTVAVILSIAVFAAAIAYAVKVMGAPRLLGIWLCMFFASAAIEAWCCVRNPGEEPDFRFHVPYLLGGGIALALAASP